MSFVWTWGIVKLILTSSPNESTHTFKKTNGNTTFGSESGLGVMFLISWILVLLMQVLPIMLLKGAANSFSLTPVPFSSLLIFFQHTAACLNKNLQVHTHSKSHESYSKSHDSLFGFAAHYLGWTLSHGFRPSGVVTNKRTWHYCTLRNQQSHRPWHQ